MSITIGIGHYSHSNGDCNDNCPCKALTVNLSIWTCAIEGHKLMIERRVREKPNLVKLTDPYGYLPLHYAAQRGHLEIVQFLIQAGSPIDGLLPPDGCGATPLHRCAYSGHLEICEVLIREGAEINARDTSFQDNRTPLMKAASQGHQVVIELLIRYGADVNLVDAQGFTYLHILNEFQQQGNSEVSDQKNMNNVVDIGSEQLLPRELSQINKTQFGIICSQCHKETYAVMSLKDNKIVCLQCGKKKNCQY